MKARRMIAGEWEDFERFSNEEKRKRRAFWEKSLVAIFERYTKRMHTLSHFMKGMLQRFTPWFNKENGLHGTLWEERFHSVIAESGLACRAMAACIGLNPVRAGICGFPENYRWSSYGEPEGGSRQFVNDAFPRNRMLFGKKRRDGARKPRGALKDLAGEIWSLRDLQKD